VYCRVAPCGSCGARVLWLCSSVVMAERESVPLLSGTRMSNGGPAMVTAAAAAALSCTTAVLLFAALSAQVSGSEWDLLTWRCQPFH